MKGFPKAIKTGQDFFNCLALMQAGQLSAAALREAITAVERRAYIACPLMSVSEDRKTVTVCYCSEAQAGAVTGNGTNNKIVTVEHVAGEGGGMGGDTPDTSVITLSKALAVGETALCVPAPVSPFDEMGLTEEQLNSMKVVLLQYE